METTYKEAIETLKANYPDRCFSMLREAVDVAIQALVAQEASNSILNSVRCHNMSIDTVSKIIMLCGPACDALSPDGFIKWLKDRITDDPRIREEMENDRM